MENYYVSLLVKWLDDVPMGGYRTYIINAALAVAWIAVGFLYGHWEIAAGFIGLSVSNIFYRKAVEGQAAKLSYMESMLEKVTLELTRRGPK